MYIQKIAGGCGSAPYSAGGARDAPLDSQVGPRWLANVVLTHYDSRLPCLSRIAMPKLWSPYSCHSWGDGGWWRWALVSPDGVAPSRMVGVSASVNLPLHHKVQKFSSGTSSPGWSRKKGRKTVVCVCYSCHSSLILFSLAQITRRIQPPVTYKESSKPRNLHICITSSLFSLRSGHFSSVVTLSHPLTSS